MDQDGFDHCGPGWYDILLSPSVLMSSVMEGGQATVGLNVLEAHMSDFKARNVRETQRRPEQHWPRPGRSMRV